MDYKAPVLNVQFNNIFLISDLHFGVRSNSREWLDNHENFFYNFYIPYLKRSKQNNDILLILGDVFDSRQSIDIFIFNATLRIIKTISEIIPIYIIVGNHDCALKNSTDINSLVGFKFIPNVNIFEKPTIISNGISNLFLMPWIGVKEEEENYAKENVKTCQYMFAHTDIAGFKYDTGKTIIKGTNLREIKYKKIFSGHIHKRQELENLYYIGSPYHTKRGDIGNKKLLFKFNPDNDSIETEENNLSPIFQRIKLEDILDWNLTYVKFILNNNYTDIIVPDKYINLFNLTKFIELLNNCSYKKIETVGEKIRTDDDLSAIIEGENIKDILTLLEISLDELKYNKEFIDKLKLLNKQYYEKANTQ